ncbi:MAG: type transport system ATP-binding protein, partial [Actinomycetota bacterium]|nr:type transport system ATP-binding protein [Actinomycetota bacterium]
LDGFTAGVRPGRITAFLGANGSGKTTSMRLLLGLSDPTSGSATIDGKPYAQLRRPMRTIGAVLDQGFHPNRTARNHLGIVAAQAGASPARVPVVLETVGLADAANRRVGGFSLGMRQRLALASALIGEPAALVLDEPFNGLDPEGIQTMRIFLRHFADQGGTVFLSSHLLSEVAHSADDALIIDRGRLVSSGPVASLVPDELAFQITSPDTGVLTRALVVRGARVEACGADQILVEGLAREEIGRAALDAGAVVYELRARGDDLESIFTNLIHRNGPSR